MRIALIDVDNMNKHKVAFPSLPLMKLAAHHKNHGDTVEWWFALDHYDIAYKSKVFDFSLDVQYEIKADAVFEGGTGYGLGNRLPDGIEHIMPDYSMYPNFKEAYGFLTRGCPRQCPFCIVSQKEGAKSVQVADLSEFWNGQRVIKLLDPNLLACQDHESLLRQLIKSGARIDFTQGLDIRLTTSENTELLRQINIDCVHFAWDNPREDLTEYFEQFRAASGITDYRKLAVYVLTNYNTTHEEDIYRVETLRDLGYSPYVMIYDKENAPRETRKLQRWVNNRIIFRTVENFSEYDRREYFKP